MPTWRDFTDLKDNIEKLDYDKNDDIDADLKEAEPSCMPLNNVFSDPFEKMNVLNYTSYR